MSHAPMRNALTVDVEDYYHVAAFASHVAREDWDRLPSRVERNVNVILAMLEEHGTRATFFVLGWVAERYPQLVRRIVAQGHELASHGYAHQRATEQDRGEFLQDIQRAKSLLEDIAGVAILGYRAPSFSIGEGNPWASECLSEAGYRYSSSVYPIRHDHYGVPKAPRFAFLPANGHGLLELPITTVRLFCQNLPAGGGGYFRLLPYGLSRWCLARVNAIDRQPCIFYFHPWEVDPEQPRFHNAAAKAKFRHYLNLGRTEARLRRLLADFKWDAINSVFPELRT